MDNEPIEIQKQEIPALKKKNNKQINIITVILSVLLSALTASLSSVITVKITLKNTEIDNANSYESESATLCEEEFATQNYTEIPTQPAVETTIVYVTVPTTFPETTQTTTQPTTEAPTNPSKSSIYSTAVHSVVGVSSYCTKYTRTLLGGVKSKKEYSSGSGFFVSDDGYVVTNAHVIEDAEVITVTDYEENSYEATLIAKMENNDIAILKIDASTKSVNLGSSSLAEVGDDCMIIGNPMGNLSYTYTDGIISYINREITTNSGYNVNMYQTNCAINSGNSGGPVFNNEGKVIGIATAKYSTSEGLSFFIPIDDFKDFIYENIY